jgi:hypothetical protein
MLVLPSVPYELVPLKEDDELPSEPPVVTYNWAHTKVLSYAPIESPSTIEALVSIIKTHSRIRPVGSRLTYEALTKSEDGILLDISSLPHGLISITKESAMFWAGTTIEEISDILIERGFYFDTSPGGI